MEQILSNIKIQVNPKNFVKDPDTSALGKRIIEQSILLIDEIGFDDFTFKKLGQKIPEPGPGHNSNAKALASGCQDQS